jgi:glycosyltransferase involved in cell wall biosynthesis
MPEKKKILRIIARLNIGGPAIHCILLTQGLNKDRFQSLLVCGNVDKTEADMLYLAREKNVEPIFISSLGRNLNLFKDLAAFFRIFSIIRKEQPDIIHTHTAKAGALGRLAGLLYNFTLILRRGRKGVKLVHTFHGHVLHSYFSATKTKIFIWIERILARFSDKIIAVSNEVRNELLSLKIADPEKLRVIPLGLELDSLLGLDEKRNSHLNIGIIGRLAPVKNQMLFLQAVKALRDCSDANLAKFIIAGDGELRSSLEEKAKDLGIAGFVEFIGWQKDLKDLYSRLDIVALTSLNEGTPVSLIEAMAAGKAVVATDVGGVKDIVNGQRGILVKSGDVNGFANALRCLIEDNDLRRKMGRSGREFVRKLFCKERLIADIQNLYDELTYTFHC